MAIPSALGLAKVDREFIIYESSLSDILGVIAFNAVDDWFDEKLLTRAPVRTSESRGR